MPRDCFLCQLPAEFERLENRNCRVQCKVCGQYELSEHFENFVSSQSKETRGKLSIGCRQANRQGAVLVLSVAEADRLAASVRLPLTPLDVVDELIKDIANGSAFGGAAWVLYTDFALYRLYSEAALAAVLKFIVATGYVSSLDKASDGYLTTLSVKGWEYAHQLLTQRVPGNRAFVAMSFNPALLTIFTQAIGPALEATGYDPIRIDREHYLGKIDDKMIAELRTASLVIADFTEHRAGVYYEAGFAEGLGTRVIYTCREDEIKNAHFDTNHTNHLLWASESELQEKLILRIRALGLSLKT